MEICSKKKINYNSSNSYNYYDSNVINNNIYKYKLISINYNLKANINIFTNNIKFIYNNNNKINNINSIDLNLHENKILLNWEYNHNTEIETSLLNIKNYKFDSVYLYDNTKLNQLLKNPSVNLYNQLNFLNNIE